MKFKSITTLLLLVLTLNSFSSVKWLSLQEAQIEAKTTGKKIMVLYITPDCNDCDKLLSKTLESKAVQDHIKNNFIAVKFDASSTQEVVWNNKKYGNNSTAQKKDLHSFNKKWTARSTIFPSFAFFNDELQFQQSEVGFYSESQLVERLDFHRDYEFINWMSWEEASALMEKDAVKKKLFVDVYTNWCGWCKKMDQSSFKDQEVVKLMNANFYPVKLNAEQKEDINHKSVVFVFDKSIGRRGAHTLAASLLDGKLGYPAFVVLNQEYSREQVYSGYQKSNVMVKILDHHSKLVTTAEVAPAE